MTDSTEFGKCGVQVRSGNARLCHELRNLPELARLRDQLRDSVVQLSYLDKFSNHDEILREEDVAIAQGGRTELTALSLARAELSQSLRHLRCAHRHVAGAFKGELRDETEESLARAIKGAELRLLKIEQIRQEYKQPMRPHEIRRNTLSFLIARCSEVCERINTVVTHLDEDTVDYLRDEVRHCALELAQLKERLEILRERCSQKMGQNLRDCCNQLDETAGYIEAVELEAGRIAGLWFADYAART